MTTRRVRDLGTGSIPQNNKSPDCTPPKGILIWASGVPLTCSRASRRRVPTPPSAPGRCSITTSHTPPYASAARTQASTTVGDDGAHAEETQSRRLGHGREQPKACAGNTEKRKVAAGDDEK